MADHARRRFLAGLGALAAAPLAARLAAADSGSPGRVAGFGPLEPDGEGLLDLPAGFHYRIVSRPGDAMDDGFVVPGLADDMHAFAAPGGKCVLVRNHELAPDSAETAFRAMRGALDAERIARIYDAGAGRGGVTTAVVDTASARVEAQYLTLAGTLRNCSGGATPWGSWITCEEMVVGVGDFGAQRAHGYNFEVPASARGLVDPLPLTAMGRFNHEAAVVDARTGVVYQTEDRPDGLLYRFLPSEPGRLAAGGRLQALALRGMPGVHTGNRRRGAPRFAPRERHPVEWLDLEEPDSPGDDLRYQGRSKGAAVLVRCEGMAVETDAGGGAACVWIVATTGGASRLGQLWCYRPSPEEGRADERHRPATLELALEPRHIEWLANGDNLTVAPFGDLVVCEDNDVAQHLVGVTASGGVYRLAANARRDSEFAGATFSPDGATLFVNLQRPGLTLAIKGPWHTRRDAPD